MKSRKMVRESAQTRRAKTQKRQRKSPTGMPTDPSLNSRSVLALISDLRGRFVGEPSLIATLRQERRKDDRAKTRKFMAMERGPKISC